MNHLSSGSLIKLWQLKLLYASSTHVLIELHQNVLMMSNPTIRHPPCQRIQERPFSIIYFIPFQVLLQYSTQPSKSSTAGTRPASKTMPSRSTSPYRSAENLTPILGLRSEDESRDATERPDHSQVTSRGAPARHSRRQRSEYRSWDRASDVPRSGTTGSKYRSRSRH